jgi:hypothetical protein
MMSQNTEVIERTSVVMYALLEEVFSVFSNPKDPDQTSLGIIMGMAMFLDDKIGPMRAENLMAKAPGIILRTDAYVTETMVQQILPVMRAFGQHLTARFESQGGGRRFRFGWARRCSIMRMAARVTMASETSGSSS